MLAAETDGLDPEKWSPAMEFDPDVFVRPGVGILAPERQVPRRGRIDLFKCKAKQSCLEFSLLAPPGDRTACEVGLGLGRIVALH